MTRQVYSDAAAALRTAWRATGESWFQAAAARFAARRHIPGGWRHASRFTFSLVALSGPAVPGRLRLRTPTEKRALHRPHALPLHDGPRDRGHALSFSAKIPHPRRHDHNATRGRLKHTGCSAAREHAVECRATARTHDDIISGKFFRLRNDARPGVAVVMNGLGSDPFVAKRSLELGKLLHRFPVGRRRKLRTGHEQCRRTADDRRRCHDVQQDEPGSDRTSECRRFRNDAPAGAGKVDWGEDSFHVGYSQLVRRTVMLPAGRRGDCATIVHS